MNDEAERIWKESSVVYLRYYSRAFLQGLRRNYESSQSVYTISRMIIENGIFEKAVLLATQVRQLVMNVSGIVAISSQCM